jgi:hypothetical protein
MIINFEITKDGFTHRDALVLPDNHNLTKAEIEAMKQARFDAWYALMTLPPGALEMEKMTDG